MSLIIFLLILLVLVLSHEAGHFWTARLFGIKVEEFGFGIPPRVFTLKKDKKGTIYSINLLPFGGFVKIFGEDLPAGGAGGSETENSESFGSKPWWARAIVLASGVFANILLAAVLFTIISAIGVPQAVSDEDYRLYPDAKITILDVASGSPAEFSGVVVGDSILGLKSENADFTPETIEDMQKFIKENAGKNLILNILRGKEKIEIVSMPRQNPPDGEGALGVVLGLIHTAKSSWYLAPIDGARLTWQALKETVLGFLDLIKRLAQKDTSNIQISGPVGIFNITSSAISFGFNTLLMLVALLSINLAVINVLPIPGLDGGRLFFVLIETIRGKRISAKISAITHGTGLAILIILMLLVTYHDLAKIF